MSWCCAVDGAGYLACQQNALWPAAGSLVSSELPGRALGVSAGLAGILGPVPEPFRQGSIEGVADFRGVGRGPAGPSFALHLVLVLLEPDNHLQSREPGVRFGVEQLPPPGLLDSHFAFPACRGRTVQLFRE
jgi:hypothetical protein